MATLIMLPRGGFVNVNLFVRDTAIEALGRRDAELGFRHIEPTAMFWRIVPLEALDEPPCFGAGKAS